MAQKAISTRFNVKKDGEHYTIHPETNENMVVLSDGTRLKDFVAKVNDKINTMEEDIRVLKDKVL